jgi:hypothetical protein
MSIAKLEDWYTSSMQNGGGIDLPAHEKLIELLDDHTLASKFKADDRLPNMMKDVIDKDNNYATDYELRLPYKHALRRILTICKENGLEVKADLSFR